MCGWIRCIERSHKLEEFLCSSLFEQAHQGRRECFSRSGGDFGNACSGACALLDETACDLSEFEIASDIRRDEDIGEFSICHKQLWDQVDVPIVDSAIFLPRLSSSWDIAVFLE